MMAIRSTVPDLSDERRAGEGTDWTTGQETEMIPAHCGLGHRTSIFKHSKRWTILAVTLALTPSKLGPPLTYRAVAEAAGVTLGEQVLLDETVAAIRQVRNEKGMILDSCGPDGRTAGSVFLSPSIPADAARHLRADGAPVNDFPDGTTRVSASWLISAAGFSLGQRLSAGARISTRHFTLVADDGATAASFADAAATIAEQVQQATGVTLTAEPDLLGDLPAYARLSPHGS
jgi:UDP-N-acetylmuramate dehydrogenase